MPITLTSWNVQNFASDSPLFLQKRDFIVSTLQAIGSDVIALQEILDVAALQALAGGLGFHAHAGIPDGRGNRVAFLTRQTVPAPQAITQFALPATVQVQSIDENGVIQALTQFRRPALQVTIMHNSRAVEVVNAHLKSKLLTFGDNFNTSDETLRVRTAYFALQLRAAESTTLREHVTTGLANGRDLVVLGDLNDGPAAATTQLLYGPPGSQARGPEDATHATGAFQRNDADDPRRLFNVCNFVPANLRWSRRHDGQPELLDHILVSAGLMPRAGNGLRQVPNVSILNDDVPNLVGTNPNVVNVVPDHAPVTATFA
jgi:endonuclease/exonuclease/phosphatase family metal-dependent hydrolase